MEKWSACTFLIRLNIEKLNIGSYSLPDDSISRLCIPEIVSFIVANRIGPGT